jgi:hypothetical protein
MSAEARAAVVDPRNRSQRWSARGVEDVLARRGPGATQGAAPPARRATPTAGPADGDARLPQALTAGARAARYIGNGTIKFCEVKRRRGQVETGVAPAGCTGHSYSIPRSVVSCAALHPTAGTVVQSQEPAFLHSGASMACTRLSERCVTLPFSDSCPRLARLHAEPPRTASCRAARPQSRRRPAPTIALGVGRSPLLVRPPQPRCPPPDA